MPDLTQQNVTVVFQIDDARPSAGGRMAEAIEELIAQSGIQGRVLFYAQNSVNQDQPGGGPPQGFGGPMGQMWSN